MVQILLPDGRLEAANSEQTVAEVIKQFVGAEDEASKGYALVFFGRKLGANLKLTDVPNLTDGRPIRLIRQIGAKNGKTPTLSSAETDKLIGQCRQIYTNLGEELQQQLENYLMDSAKKFDDFKQSLFAEHPQLLFDPLALSVVQDMRLLVPYILENKEFPYERPYCVQVLKRVLQDLVTTELANQQQLAGPSNRNAAGIFPPAYRLVPPNAAGASRVQQQQPLITADMLSMALRGASAVSVTNSSSTATSSAAHATGQPQPAINPSPTPTNMYATQLAKLAEFGFTNVEENIQALQMAEGNVEVALEFLISMRE